MSPTVAYIFPFLDSSPFFYVQYSVMIAYQQHIDKLVGRNRLADPGGSSFPFGKVGCCRAFAGPTTPRQRFFISALIRWRSGDKAL